ncbi:MAG: NAD(P)-dependent oxidoreductase [Alphaproteobacteria bacterium]|nr:NAD(P)-dependent oxidoreductase [Alphaproteobacteria bacterium]
MDRTVGVVGLGLMGEVLARRLMAAGFSVVGYDVDPAKNEKLASLGGTSVASPAEVAHCGTVVLAVFNTDQVEDVTEKALKPAAKPGTVVLCTSTCDPDRIEALAGRLAGSNLRFLETPVSGTSEQVRAGDGVGLIGGNRAVAEQAKPVLDALFPRRFHIGKAGDGGRAKLAVNLILGLNRMALAEGLAFAERIGLDGQAFLEVAKGSASYSQVMETKGSKMLKRDFAPEGRVKQTLKDVHMMLEQGECVGQDLPMLRVHCDVLESCVRAGEAERDNSSIVEEIRRRRR